MWLVLGLALGVAASVLVAAIFYAGEKLFPTTEPPRDGPDRGSLRRHAEIRQYLSAIGEPYIEEYEQAGLTIALYLPDRDVAITFDPRVLFGLEDAATHVILCEDEMPAANLGKRLPFEVPDAPRQPPKSNDPVTAAYEYLGLTNDASATEIQQAYRTQVKEVHPDRGGTDEEFKQLQEAYTKAKNDADGTA
ncbi:J domain-containing protein [Halonotius terrestris]|uniref:J domain-containing protein n=2 Tax=Halonotius terrestris TaxID=2487750 RepID=A0A8J8TDE2_9EURY|nr:J domain-containing protein [Halonotius terrestris]